MNYVEEIKNILFHWIDEYEDNELLSKYNPWGPALLFNIQNGIGKDVNEIIKAYVDYFSSAYTFYVDGDGGADYLEIPLLSEIFTENPIKIQIDEDKYIGVFVDKTNGIQRIISQQIFEVLSDKIVDSFNKQNVVEAKVAYLKNRCFFVIEKEMTKVFNVNDFNLWINNFNDVKLKNGEYGNSSYNEFELTIRFCGKEKQFLEFPRTISMELLVYNDLLEDERFVKRTFKLELDKKNIIHLINLDKVTDEEFVFLIERCKNHHIIKEGYFTVYENFEELVRQIVKEDYTYKEVKIVDVIWHDEAFKIASEIDDELSYSDEKYYIGNTGGFLIKFNTDIRNFTTNVNLAKQSK